MKSKIKYTPLQYILEALSLAALLYFSVYFVITWTGLPEIVEKFYIIGDSGSEMVEKISLVLLPICNVGFYIFLTIYSRNEEKWRISVSVTKANHDAVYSAYRDLIISVKLIAVLAIGIVSWFDLNGNKGIVIPQWLLFAMLIVCLADIVVMFMRLNKASETKALGKTKTEK